MEADISVPQQKPFCFNGSNMDVNKFFFIYDNVVKQGKQNDQKALDLITFLYGLAFDFYYETYAEDETLSSVASDYPTVRKALKDKFKVVENPATVIRSAVNASLDENHILESLQGLETLYTKAGFNDEAKFGFLTTALSGCEDDLSKFVF